MAEYKRKRYILPKNVDKNFNGIISPKKTGSVKSIEASTFLKTIPNIYKG